MNKRGQIAIFVIIAILIASVILVVFLNPGGRIGISEDVNPSSYLSNCIEPKVSEALEILSKQGGSLNPENYVLYRDQKVEYLCYTNKQYSLCSVQQPLLVMHIEDEIKSYVEPVARQCIRDLEERYESQGYIVSTTPGDLSVDFAPGKISIEFDSPMTIEKDSTQTFRKFAVSINSEMYDLLMTAVSIIQYESALGDSETLLYLQYYPDLSIKKVKREGDTIYTLKNVVTNEAFTFASRSLVWPAGYGLGNP